MILAFFNYLENAVSETLFCSAIEISLVERKTTSVVWMHEKPATRAHRRFVRLRGIPDREEFALHLGWSNKPRFPEANCESIRVSEPIAGYEVSPVDCSVPLSSKFVLGEDSQHFSSPLFEVECPTITRLEACIVGAAMNMESMARLRDLCEVSGIPAPGSRDATENPRAIVTAVFGVTRLPVDWQVIDHLTGLDAADCEAALDGPASVACALLLSRGIPRLLA